MRGITALLTFSQSTAIIPITTNLCHFRDDEFGDSVGSGATLDIREQLERAVTRASFRPDDTLGDIDRQLAAKGAAVGPAPERSRSNR